MSGGGSNGEEEEKERDWKMERIRECNNENTAFVKEKGTKSQMEQGSKERGGDTERIQTSYAHVTTSQSKCNHYA